MIRVRFSLLFVILALIGLTTTQCSKDNMDPNTSSSKPKGDFGPSVPGGSLDAPTITLKTKGMASLVLHVCAGATGAQGGYSIQWMKKSDFVAAGNTWNENANSFCAASFSGNANSSRYSQGPNECVDIRIGELLLDNGASSACNIPLECGTEYVFRSFAHNVPQGLKKSDWSANFFAATWACEIKPNMTCTRTAGEWKSNPLDWPAAATPMMIGNTSYTKNQLVQILGANPANNGLIALAHQVIAAKLNVANGSPNSYVWHPLFVVDQMIGNLVIPPVGGGSLTYATVNERMNYLWNYNDGAIGPGHCF